MILTILILKVSNLFIKMEKKKTDNLKCSKCKFTTKDSKTLQKHNWTWHPMNNYEKSWSKHAKEGFCNWTGSSYYESFGPYY